MREHTGRDVGGGLEGRALRAAAAALVLVSACCLMWCGGCAGGDASESHYRADVVEISIAGPGRKAVRPSVQFPHDKHTEAVASEGGDCETCHRLMEDGYLSPLYMRLVDKALSRPSGDSRDAAPRATVDELMELYHDNCLACHTRRATEGLSAGPVSCGECHRAEPVNVSSMRPFGMDKSLHYRHNVARSDKCEDCHHLYDEKAEKLIYEKGQENPCRDCHLTVTEENRVAYKTAAHWACIKCHMDTAKLGPDVAAGPRACGGCHDIESQLAIKVVENVPRLDRGQPDFVLLSAPQAELESSKFRTVPFSHVGHEGFTETCRACHHRAMKRCNECHTLPGSKEGGDVMLQSAMHGMASNHSCAGCHELQKNETGCAGCHDLMERGRLSEHACDICHVGPSPENLEAERSLYTSLDQFRPRPSDMTLSLTVSEIPDSVVISVLSKEYEPAVMPHRKIVNKLREHIESNRMATRFHGHEDVVCQGCHHHGSVGEKPALCENCHGRPFDEKDTHKPGLYGAYHRQCLGCHQSMGLKDPSDCAGCHEKRKAATG